MKAIALSLALLLTSASALVAFKMSGKGENYPVVSSAFGGTYYIRTVPAEDYGNAGKTGVYQVGKERDKLLDEYPIYMRGELFLGWNPLEGAWSVVQLQPERITSADEREKLGNVDRLAFYMGGEELRVYSQEDLAALGLVKHQAHLTGPGSFTVQGIEQVPRTNHYVFKVTGVGRGSEPVLLSFDISTGKLTAPEPGN